MASDDRVETGPVNPPEPSPLQDQAPPSAMRRTAGIDLARENPYLAIWLHPRRTIRGIVDTNPSFGVMPITLISGIVLTLGIAASTGQAAKVLPMWGILALSVALGPLIGLAFLYAGAWLVAVSCRIVGRPADLPNIRAELAWSMVPIVATIPLWIARLVVFGEKNFVAEIPRIDETLRQNLLLLLALGIGELVLQIWSLAILLAALKEVQGFSIWASIGCMLALALVLVIAVVIAVAVMILQ